MQAINLFYIKYSMLVEFHFENYHEDMISRASVFFIKTVFIQTDLY